MHTTNLLPIGAFSNATQLSAKALRLYAAQGILVPARVDAETGYRYYRPEQVRDARLVRLLRELDMPLAEIATLISHPAMVGQSVKKQIEKLARRHARQLSMYHTTLELLHQPTTPASVGVREHPLGALTTLGVPFEANAENLLVRAHAVLASLQSNPHLRSVDESNAFIPFSMPMSGLDEIDIELHVPASMLEHPAQTYAWRNWPAQSGAAVRIDMQDGAPDLVSASDALFDWFDRRGCSLRDAPRVYLNNGAPTLIWPIS